MIDLPTLSSFSYQLLILLTTVVSKTVISHFITHEPLRFFQFYCQQLSNKVNKPQNSHQQQTIAGLIAIVITLAPIIIILWLFAAFIAVDFLWQVCLLYLALGAFGLSKINTQVAKALVAKQNNLAKQTLKPWLLRETEALSPLGLSKAAIEMKLLRTLGQGYTVAVLFMLAGPLTALAYRLLLEMHYCWNSKLDKYRYFGFYSKLFVSLLQWLPVRIFFLLLIFSHLGHQFLLFWRLSKAQFLSLNNTLALLIFALSLQIKLGGVAMYKNNYGKSQKLRKTSVNDLARQPQASDIVHANNKINYLLWLSLLLLVFSAIGIELVIANI